MRLNIATPIEIQIPPQNIGYNRIATAKDAGEFGIADASRYVPPLIISVAARVMALTQAWDTNLFCVARYSLLAGKVGIIF